MKWPCFAAFNSLTNLRELNLSGNELNGSLPGSLFTLPRLKILDLSDNLFLGRIPINSSSGPIALEVLNLKYNGISGTIPVTGKLHTEFDFILVHAV